MESNMEKAVARSSRYERKFAVSGLSGHSLKAAIKLHPAFFKEVYSPRQINNIYLDTPRLKAFHDNTSGISKRQKRRIRWYGPTFGEVDISVLEYKIKLGMLGQKHSWQLASFHLDRHFDKSSLTKLFEKSELPDRVRKELLRLSPKLLNTYYRTYYLSADRNFRITIDEGLTYYQIRNYNNQFLKFHQKRGETVLELKYNAELDEQADEITRHFKFRLTKSSKYVNGIYHNRPFIPS